MKYKIYAFYLLASSLLIFNSCTKDIVEANLQYPMLEHIRTDSNAGIWKPILITSPADIACAAPIATTSPDYVIQLNQIKSYQSTITEEEQKLLDYWGAGAVLRWNEIMRELVAKHNLPPANNPDNTYPIPSANNPLEYPTFPFSNPPYAARAYAYLSTAQYDALITTYHYKQKYKRTAPYNVNTGIQALLPKSTISSYPSEDATVIGVSVEILKLLFPGDQDYIDQKAAEHKKARLLSGSNVQSDLDAGESIGKAVATKFITRARGDRAGAAGGNASIWASIKQSTIDKGETPWISQESPERPPMLPLYGKVKAFLFDSLTMITSIRPAAPFSTKSDAFKKELEDIYQQTSNLTRAQLAIANYWSDGPRTYTPPGHWNYIAASDFVAQQYSEVRWARNMALLNMALMDAAIVCWDAKYTYNNPRPMQVDARIKTCIGLPNFPSYISGHSSFSGAASTVLSYIIPDNAKKYSDMAKEASISRMYGGIHYRSDCEIGITTGNKVGEYAVKRGWQDGAE
jgi:hypothetical protein